MKKMARPSKKRFWKLPKEYRKAFYKEVIRIHENNLKTYVSVMTGNF
jgi:hypothetical protein